MNWFWYYEAGSTYLGIIPISIFVLLCVWMVAIFLKKVSDDISYCISASFAQKRRREREMAEIREKLSKMERAGKL